MSIEVKTFPNATSANAATNAAKSTWVAPTITFILCQNQARLLAVMGPLQMATPPIELINGRFAVKATHPSFKGEFIEASDVKPGNDARMAVASQVVVAQSVGASSGIVAKPGAEQRRKDVA